MTNNRTKEASAWKQVAPWLRAILVLVALIIIFSLMTWLLRPWETISSLSPDDWSTIGEILRNTSGWVALPAAAGTITAMMITNRSRAREASAAPGLLAILALVFVSLAIIFCLMTWLTSLSGEQWHLAGEISRNTNALAVIAASIAAYIAWNTNKARAQESIRSDFKDRIHWASLNYASEDPMQADLAESTIIHFSVSNSLSSEDATTAKRLAETLGRVKAAEQEKRGFLLTLISSMSNEFSQLNGEFEILPEDAKAWLMDTQRLNSFEFQQLSIDYQLASLEVKILPTLANLNQTASILAKLIELLGNALKDWREHVNHNRPDSGD